ncbi:hypothetical protein [Actibacterium sp. 188UL27-1]|nr:hypothetical protein [Actibacterium sp. 188UL27-1]MBM7069666.1 hypothetical protein [Actibacterium sp. 188UL27-1]
MKQPLFSAFVKATDKLSGPPKASLAWAFSKRTQFEIWDDRVTIGQ